MELKKITEKELLPYLTELVSLLRTKDPYTWIKISDIANDVDRFIGIVEMLAKERIFSEEDCYCIIEIKEDSLVRLDPEFIINQNKRIYGNSIKTKK